MADENIQTAEAAEEPQGEPKAKTDWKAEARKWEALAKKGKAAEDELAKLKEAQMTENEKANARAEKAEAELAAVKAENERLTAAREYSASQGVPLELLEFVQADKMEGFCKAYKAVQLSVPSVAPASFKRIVSEGGKVDPKDAFIAFAKDRLQ